MQEVLLESPTWLFIVLSVIGVVVSVLVGAAMVIAVVQHYTGQRVDVGECLYRAWSRVLSLLVTYILLFLALALLSLAALYAAQSNLTGEVTHVRDGDTIEVGSWRYGLTAWLRLS